MRLAAISDLHYPESKVDLAELARLSREAQADVLVLAGDAVSQFHPPRLAEVFSALKDAAPIRIYVPGNHELWSREGSTAAIYEQHLPKIAEEHGFAYLDAGPVLVGDVAIVGNVGWYDYSFTDRVTFADIRVALGREMFVAARGKEPATYRIAELTDAHIAQKAMVVLPDENMKAMGLRPALLRWNDRRFVRLGVPDQVFAADCARRLREHLADAANKADRIVVAMHCAPFEKTLPPSAHPIDSISRAYQGAKLLGDVILEEKKVSLVLHGHRHRPGVHQVEHLPVINVTARPDRGGSVVIRDV